MGAELTDCAGRAHTLNIKSWIDNQGSDGNLII